MNSIIKTRIEEIKSGKVPSGYKKTKIGIFPLEWEEKRFKTMFCRLQRKNEECNTNVLTISAQYGLINQGDFFNKEVASDDKSNYYLINKGEWTYNKSYSSGYPFGAIKRLEKYDKGIVSPLYICFSQTQENKCPDFYLQYFENGLLDKEIKAIAQEGARNHGLLNLGIDDFFNTLLIVPPVKEQEKIAEILKTQDRVIELKEKLLKEKQREKKYLMQQLLTGKIRLKGFTGEWEKINVGKVIEEVSFRNSDGQMRNVMSVSNDRGFIDQSTQFDKIVASKDTTNYKIVTKGIFAYNPSRVNVGSLALYMDENESIVSPMYITFKCNNVEDRYLYLWFKSFMFISQLKKYLSGSVRDSLNINDLFLFNIALPGLAEQQAIVKVIMTKDREIALIKQQIENEKQKKKALMQLLLSGIVRVS